MYGDGVTRGKVSIVAKELTTNQACCNIEVDETKALFKYVYYCLRQSYNKFRHLSNGGAQQNLNVSLIKKFKIKLPSLKDQLKTSNILTVLDDKIELNNQIRFNFAWGF